MRDAAEVRPERSEHTPVLYCLLVEVNLHVCVMVVVAGTQTPVLRSRSPHSEDSHRDATIRNAERKANRRCDRLVAEKLALPTGTQKIYFYLSHKANDIFCGSFQGHFVRLLGDVGDRETENEVLLLEHDVPHSKFSSAVLECLPKLPWLITQEVNGYWLKCQCVSNRSKIL